MIKITNICILGATGSIGTQTLDVIRKEKTKFSLIAISANKNYNKAIEIINEFAPKYVVITDYNSYINVEKYCKQNFINIELIFGLDGFNVISTLKEVDIVVNSVVGMIGLAPTLKAIESGKDIALANKETLVVGGRLVISEAYKKNVNILPIDSEHGAIFQCIQGNSLKDINSIFLTASGGPFRGYNYEMLKDVTVNEALNHPNWSMGKKISIDSATLMNKGLEVIEAHWLFNVDYEDIKVIVHPQSIIHSAVEFKDNSILAQLGVPDMKLPIQYALNYPERKDAVVEELDLFEIGNLSFEKPDIETFKCLKLAYEAGKLGYLMPTILNASNEVAVELFINNKITFLQIPDIVEECMLKFDYKENVTLNNILECDNKVRTSVKNKYGK